MASLSRTFVLRTEGNAAALHTFLKQNAKAMAEAGKPLAVTVSEHKERRSADQNRLFHVLLTQISEQAWMGGKQYDVYVWKEMVRRKFVGTEEVDLPDGTRFERSMSTAKLDVGEFSKLIDIVSAWATTELGVEV